MITKVIKDLRRKWDEKAKIQKQINLIDSEPHDALA